MRFLLHHPEHPEQEAAPFAVPRIYVSEPVRWEYKQLARDMEGEGLLEEEALDALGADGWELAAAVSRGQRVTYIFKRVAN